MPRDGACHLECTLANQGEIDAMNARDVSDEASDGPGRTNQSSVGWALIHLGSLDIRGLRARVDTVDGDLSMFVDDGDVEIELSSGLGGTRQQAVDGADQLAQAAHEYAEKLRGSPAQSKSP
jgi:hypothetical protein